MIAAHHCARSPEGEDRVRSSRASGFRFRGNAQTEVRECRSCARSLNQNGSAKRLFWRLVNSPLIRLPSLLAVGVVRLTKSKILPSLMP
jgi:hypothetical protein